MSRQFFRRKNDLSSISSSNRTCLPWYGKTILVISTIQLILSTISSFDCSFIRLNIGFVPYNSYDGEQIYGIGIFTFEKPSDTLNMCYSLNSSGGLIKNHSYYTNDFLNKDVSWSVSRVMALAAMSFEFIVLVSNIRMYFMSYYVNTNTLI